MDRKARLFALAEHLRARRTGVTADALAERFGVTVRTMYRDLDALREAEMPLHADRGRGGGYALDKSYSLGPVNFSAREAALLVTLGRFATQLRLLPFEDTLAGALDKVRAALGASGQRELRLHDERLHVVGVPAPPVNPHVRRTIERAWYDALPVALSVLKRDGSRYDLAGTIEAVLMERSMTVLTIRESESSREQGVRLDRIEKAKLLGRNFTRPTSGEVTAG